MAPELPRRSKQGFAADVMHLRQVGNQQQCQVELAGLDIGLDIAARPFQDFEFE
jgi:hypothetical protein